MQTWCSLGCPTGDPFPDHLRLVERYIGLSMLSQGISWYSLETRGGYSNIVTTITALTWIF